MILVAQSEKTDKPEIQQNQETGQSKRVLSGVWKAVCMH